MAKTKVSMVDMALRYVEEVGMKVFPVAAGDKVPLVKNWGEVATNEPEQVRVWWQQWPDANIGWPTTNFLVVDVDTIQGKPNDWPSSELMLSMSIVVSDTPRGGTHYYFRQPKGLCLRNTASDIATNVDTRADGGYVLLPGSSVNGKYYKWRPGMDIFDNTVPEAPSWLLTMLAKKAKRTAATHDDRVLVEGERNNTLAHWAGYVRHGGGELHEVRAFIQAINYSRCQPPLGDAEVEKICESICRYSPNMVTYALIENKFVKSELGAPEEKPYVLNPGPHPEAMLSIPGFVNEFVDYCMKCAPYPNRVLAFTAALSLQAWMAGRKVRDTADIRTNMYILALADSGFGKDFPRKVVAKLLGKVGMLGCMANQLASAEGLEDLLSENPNILLMSDEVDTMMESMNDKKETRYARVMSRLMELYSSSASSIVMRRKANSKDANSGLVIHQPCLNFLGTAIPAHYYGALNAKMLTNGFLSRTLVIECTTRGDGQDPVISALPSSMEEVAKHWMAKPCGEGNLSHQNPDPYIVQYTEEARKLCQMNRRLCEEEHKAAHKNEHPAAVAVWTRVHEQTRKLALVYACSANHANPVVDEAAFRWASEFMLHAAKKMLFQVASYVGDNPFHKDCQRFMRCLERMDGTANRRKMLRNLHLPSKKIDEIASNLLEQGLIVLEKVEGARDHVYKIRK